MAVAFPLTCPAFHYSGSSFRNNRSFLLRLPPSHVSAYVVGLLFYSAAADIREGETPPRRHTLAFRGRCR